MLGETLHSRNAVVRKSSWMACGAAAVWFGWLASHTHPPSGYFISWTEEIPIEVWME